MIFQLDKDDIWFPDPSLAEPDGCLAVGGDLSPERLELAYHYGIFPWYSFEWHDEPVWYCPQDRFVIFPDEIHISHSMRALLNKNKYTVTFNQAFEQVIRRCSEQRIHHEGAWLGEDMIQAYLRLHDLGDAMSVEVWDGGKLVGGLYGVTYSECFFGESMFSDVPSGSKIALIRLAQAMHAAGWKMIDCQFETHHLKSMGARHIPYPAYMSILTTPSPRSSFTAAPL